MPFLAIAAAGSTVAKKVGLHVSLKTPSEKRAARVVPDIVASANQGNFRAVAILDSRQFIGISKERAVWAHGYAQVAPQIIAAYTPNRSKYIGAIPSTAQAGPEAAASYALSKDVAPPALDLATAPLAQATSGDTINEENLREGLAGTVEAVGVGGAAAVAKKLRGTEGPLDRIIEVAKKPAGTVALIAAGVFLLVLVTATLARRH